jgi:hypothetical protein
MRLKKGAGWLVKQKICGIHFGTVFKENRGYSFDSFGYFL